MISFSRSAMLCRFGMVVALFVALQGAITARAETNAEGLAHYRTAEAIAHQHLTTFDNLDFDVFTNQKWDRLKESHAPNIRVYWPDGHVTVGLARHIADLKAMFVYAPDTRIREHPIRIASGPWTSVVGILQGTFTKPMPMPNGKMIPPTGKAFKLRMVTVGHWVHGVMDEEYLFWDNATFMSQLGLK